MFSRTIAKTGSRLASRSCMPAAPVRACFLSMKDTPKAKKEESKGSKKIGGEGHKKVVKTEIKDFPTYANWEDTSVPDDAENIDHKKALEDYEKFYLEYNRNFADLLVTPLFATLDGVKNLMTVSSSRDSRFILSDQSVFGLADLINRLTIEHHPRRLSALLFLLNVYTSEAASSLALVDALARKTEECTKMFDTTSLAHSYYGLNGMDASKKEVAYMFSSLNRHMRECRDPFSGRDLCWALWGIKSSSTQSPEIVEYIEMLTQKVLVCHQPIDKQHWYMGLEALVRVSNEDHPCVAPLVEGFAERVIESKELKPHQASIALKDALHHMDLFLPHNRVLVSAVAKKIANHAAHFWNHEHSTISLNLVDELLQKYQEAVGDLATLNFAEQSTEARAHLARYGATKEVREKLASGSATQADWQETATELQTLPELLQLKDAIVNSVQRDLNHIKSNLPKERVERARVHKAASMGFKLDLEGNHFVYKGQIVRECGEYKSV